ncbi:MAG: hypothetical protein Q8R92_07065 [Deltaproteobacteria bacterium]|nr:hypothetical protein [Deltaproteobacteria bacterium]
MASPRIGLPQQVRDRLQPLVAHRVAVRAVDELEAVNVDEEQGERQGVPRGARDVRLRPLGEVAIGVEPRELVRQGHVPQALVDAQPLLRPVFGGAIEQVLQHRVVGIVKRLAPLFEGGDPERARKDGRIAHGVGAHHPTPGVHLAVVVLEVIAAAIDVHDHARKRRREDGCPVLVQVAVEIAHEGIGISVGEGFEPGLAVIVPGDLRQRLRAVVGHAHQDRRAPLRIGLPDDWE